MKALVGAFNQEKVLLGAFSVIVQPVVEPMEHYTALVCSDSEETLLLHLYMWLVPGILKLEWAAPPGPMYSRWPGTMDLLA